VSVHTTNPALRCEMMKNKRAGKVLGYLNRLADAGIRICGQIVLCRGVNDGEELARTMRDLKALHPALSSVSVVPAGLTRFRDGLYPLAPFTPEECRAVIAQVNAFGDTCERELGERIFCCADEFYLKAQREMPDEDYYNGFPQLENGVGMWALLKSEFEAALSECTLTELDRKITVVTGEAAYPLIKALAESAEKKIKNLTVQVVPAKNRLLGSMITVSGLLCGADIAAAVEGLDLGDELIIPPNCLRSEGDMFLDDMTVEELSDKSGIKVTQNGSSGEDLLSALTGGI